MQLKDFGLTAQDVIDKTKKYMIETYERFPFVAVRAKGMYLYDEKDNAYLDFYGGIAVNSAGNCNEKVVAAVIDQVQQLMHTFNYPYSIPQALTAELVATQSGLDKVFFQNSGTEANEAMIKIARKYGVDNYGPNRYHIVTAKNGFHGRTYGAMSATGQPGSAIHNGFEPLLPGFTYAEYNNLDDFKAKVTDDTIAIMLEPVQGEGGVRPATPEFLKGIEALCREKNMLLLIDEIQTGWYRTGTAFCFQQYGVKPDCISMAKAIGGGTPIGAIAATDKLAVAMNPGSHGSTYAGSPICCAAAYAEINELIDNKLGENATEVGDYFQTKLATLPHAVETRGKGLLVAVEFDAPKALDIKHAALDRFLLTTAIGSTIIRMVPPLIATKADADKAYEILKEAVESVY
jgi:acetylornithine/N-succinyldiaminopimelate aminotransferase